MPRYNNTTDYFTSFYVTIFLSLLALISFTPYIQRRSYLLTGLKGIRSMEKKRHSCTSIMRLEEREKVGNKIRKKSKSTEIIIFQLRGSAVERRSLAGELTLSCARPVGEG